MKVLDLLSDSEGFTNNRSLRVPTSQSLFTLTALRSLPLLGHAPPRNVTKSLADLSLLQPPKPWWLPPLLTPLWI